MNDAPKIMLPTDAWVRSQIEQKDNLAWDKERNVPQFSYADGQWLREKAWIEP